MMIFAINLVILFALLVLGVALARQRNTPPLISNIERVRHCGRWFFYAFALASASAALAISRDDVTPKSLEFQAFTLCWGIYFVFSSRYFIEIRENEVLIGTILGTRSVPIRDIRRILEIPSSGRGVRSMIAYDGKGSRLFRVTGNIEDYPYIVGQLKSKLEDGVVMDKSELFLKTERVIHHNSKHL